MATLLYINFRRAKSVLFFVTSCRGFDCSQGYHRLWLSDCSGWKAEQCAERRGDPSRGFGGYRLVRYRSEERCRGYRPVHALSTPTVIAQTPPPAIPIRAHFIIYLPL